MELIETQKQTVEQWVNEGCGLSEIQKKLSEEFGISITYMDVRFLMLDLGLEVKDKPSVTTTPMNAGDIQQTEPGTAGPGLPNDELSTTQQESGSVSVEIDRVVNPGSIASGSVTFSDGVSASWSLDQLGRLALDAGQSGYTPNRQDLQVFQQELKRALEKKSF